jgi:hypothetical protein
MRRGMGSSRGTLVRVSLLCTMNGVVSSPCHRSWHSRGLTLIAQRPVNLALSVIEVPLRRAHARPVNPVGARPE